MAVGFASPLTLSGAGTNAPGGVRGGVAHNQAILKRIASRVDGGAGVIAIEASTAVPYVASQPDPRDSW